ncbi:MAG TPA: hypothetical protein VEL31_23875 [Ktedonobacteraceae bacterium]|nr:hypothetical protein [Ktedonobacteraceae bacterium]
MWRKIRLIRPPTRPLPRETFLLTVATGDYPITWSTVSYPKEGSNTWLLGNSTDPMPTEPSRPTLRDEVEIRYKRRCTCGLIEGEWCCCALG